MRKNLPIEVKFFRRVVEDADPYAVFLWTIGGLNPQSILSKERKIHMLPAKTVAYETAKALDEKKGVGIKLLKIDKVSSLADYFLICTGTSSTHVKTLCDYAEYTLENLGEKLLGREGHRGNTWELLDFGAVVVHVFTDEARAFYDLERLWADAENIDISDILLPD